jgi:hypothetical protein
MNIPLPRAEQRYLDELLVWDEKQRPVESMVATASLLFGGLVSVAAAVVTLLDLRDATILAVLVPGVLAGLFFVAVYRVLRMRLRERHEIARLARKLVDPG